MNQTDARKESVESEASRVAARVCSSPGFAESSTQDKSKLLVLAFLREGLRRPSWIGVRKYIGGSAPAISTGIQQAERIFAEEVRVQRAFPPLAISEQLVPAFNSVLAQATETAAKEFAIDREHYETKLRALESRCNELQGVLAAATANHATAIAQIEASHRDALLEADERLMQTKRALESKDDLLLRASETNIALMTDIDKAKQTIDAERTASQAALHALEARHEQQLAELQERHRILMLDTVAQSTTTINELLQQVQNLQAKANRVDRKITRASKSALRRGKA